MINILELNPIILFAGSGFVGMVFAYYRLWAWEHADKSLAGYFFGDWHAIGRAVTTLGLLIAGAGGLDYLSAMTQQQIIVAGLGLGVIVPERVKTNG